METTPSPLGQLRVLQVIHAAMMMGLILFFGIFLILHVSIEPGMPAIDGDKSGFDPLMFVNFMLFLGASAIRFIVPPMAMKSSFKRLPRGLNELDFQAAAFPAIQTSHIMTLALLEGPALFSIVLLLINNLALKQSPSLWVNGIPALMSIILMAMLFPTASRFAMKIKEEHTAYSRIN